MLTLFSSFIHCKPAGEEWDSCPQLDFWIMNSLEIRSSGTICCLVSRLPSKTFQVCHEGWRFFFLLRLKWEGERRSVKLWRARVGLKWFSRKIRFQGHFSAVTVRLLIWIRGHWRLSDPHGVLLVLCLLSQTRYTGAVIGRALTSLLLCHKSWQVLCPPSWGLKIVLLGKVHSNFPLSPEGFIFSFPAWFSPNGEL